MTKKQKKKAKRKIRFRRVLLMLLLAVALICICLFTPLFNIKNVEIIGNSTISSEQLTQAAAIPPENNIFRINKHTISKSILSIPEIEAVKITRRLPSKVRITVTETPPIMYFPYMTGYVTTNEKGRAIALLDDVSESDLIKMTGLEIKKVEICEKISVQDTVKFDIIVETISKLNEKGFLGDIRSCHFDNLTDVHLYLKDGTKVIFGKIEELDYKLSVLENILPRVHRSEGVYIDLTTPARAFYGSLPAEAPSESPQPEDATKPKGETSEEQSEETQELTPSQNTADANENEGTNSSDEEQ